MKEGTWQEAIVKVLEEVYPEPLHYSDIAAKILSDNLMQGRVGATPNQTVSSILTSDVSRGEQSIFVRTSKGYYSLRQNNVPIQAKSTIKEIAEKELREESTTIIRAFGMYWNRNEVDWSQNPTMNGAQGPGATVVNFSNQMGIYLLNDVRDVVYVGRTTNRPIGLRLFEHTKDRLKGRWDRFSWFGIWGVNDSGALIENHGSQFSFNDCIMALEAILIEGLEPPQNRRQGDGLKAIGGLGGEYSKVPSTKKMKNEMMRKLQSLMEADI